MDKSNSQPEKSKDQPRFIQEQYDMLKRCSDRKDMTEWNEWRREHPSEVVWLQGKNFEGWCLQGGNFMHGNQFYKSTGKYVSFEKVHLEGTVFEWANLQKANFAGANMDCTKLWSADAKGADLHRTSLMNAEWGVANFENCDFSDSILENASFSASRLCGAKFTNSNLKGCSMRGCEVDGSTRFWECRINRYSKSKRFTDLTGVALDNVIIDPGTKQLFEYNIRRMNWESWYKYKNWQDDKDERHIIIQMLMWFVRKFWEISDYGISTRQIIKTFFTLTLIFASAYLAWGLIDYHLLGLTDYPGIVSNLFVIEGEQEAVSPWLVPFRAVYFSIVTMTTLGFGDMYANTHTFLRGLFGHTLLALQVILGYVLLGALVTRFAVLFAAGGPAGKFANEKEE